MNKQIIQDSKIQVQKLQPQQVYGPGGAFDILTRVMKPLLAHIAKYHIIITLYASAHELLF